MGDHDFVKPLLEELGTVVFGRVLMKPGKPMVFATVPAVRARMCVVPTGRTRNNRVVPVRVEHTEAASRLSSEGCTATPLC